MVYQASMVPAFLRASVYAAAGVTAEVIYTGLKNPPTLQGHTQLWVMPLYSLGSIYAFEPLHEKMRNQPLPIRVGVYACMIFAIEYCGGWISENLIGECPWKYTSEWAVHGYINLTFFPLWASVGFLAEKVHNYFLSLGQQKNISNIEIIGATKV